MTISLGAGDRSNPLRACGRLVMPCTWLTLFWCALTFFSQAQTTEDVSHRLMVSSSARSARILNFDLNPQDTGATLRFRSPRPMTVFIGAELVWPDRKEIQISVDSILARRGPAVQFTIVRPVNVNVLAALIRRTQNELDPGLRIRARTQEFVMLTILPLILLLAWMAIANRRMTGGYFQFNHLLTWTNREDPMSAIGMTSASNLLLYLILLGMMSVIGTLLLDSGVQSISLLRYFGRFLQILGWLMVFLTIRMIVLSLLPAVYGFRTGSGQFFGLIRLLVLLIVLTFLVFLLAFAVSWPNQWTQRAVKYMWIIGVLLYQLAAFTRLMLGSPSQALHLFSYLCISEIIPLLLFTGLLQSQANLDLR